MIFLGIGSNLSSSFGDRYKNINLALNLLISGGIELVRKSSFYETFSYPNKKNPKFINIVISINTNLSLEELMRVLLFVEDKIERKRTKKNDPRTCDIDIIDYNSRVSNFRTNNFNIIVPHKDLLYRNFVLYPLAEISPYWKHPTTHELINDIIQKLPEDDKKSILKIEKN